MSPKLWPGFFIRGARGGGNPQSPAAARVARVARGRLGVLVCSCVTIDGADYGEMLQRIDDIEQVVERDVEIGIGIHRCRRGGFG